MVTAQNHFSVGGYSGLMSRRSAQRWGRWFVFVWVAMWLSTALLPCCEVEAAVAAQEQAQHANCEHVADPAPDSDGDHKTGTCLGMTAPAPAPAERLAASIGSTLSQLAPGYATPSHVPTSMPAFTRLVAYRAAPPPMAVYLRSQRLRI